MSDDRIYAVGYRRLQQKATLRSPVWPIARTMLVLAWRKRATKIALLACGAVFVIFGFGVVGQLVAQRFAGDLGGELLGNVVGNTQNSLAIFVSVQFYFTTFAIAVVAGGAVADDRSAGAFDLYFSRPLTRGDYALGKLWGAAIAGAVLASTIVGLSAFGTSARGVGIAYVAVLVGIGAVCEGLAAAGLDWAGYLSPSRDLRTVSDALLAVGPKALLEKLAVGRAALNDSALFSMLGLAGYIVAGIGGLWKRLSDEVVG